MLRNPATATNDEKIHTLEEYSLHNFSTPAKTKSKKRPSFSCVNEQLQPAPWRFTRELISEPLLKRVQQHPDNLSKVASCCFLQILKYAGDHRLKHKVPPVELTDQLFEPPLKHEPLRDEVYCQIIKQLTGNRNHKSREKGWELLWLASGCFPPSSELLPEVTKFLQSALSTKNNLAQPCLDRIEDIQRYGPRRYPPHPLEIEAARRKSAPIKHKVCFPDNHDETFEVESVTQTGDMCRKIATRLNLKSAEGISLCLDTSAKFITLPLDGFFFDCIRRPILNDSSAQLDPSYTLFCMKTWWAKTIPGEDPNSDIVFHYPQEYLKYLRGYHKCTLDDAVRLAAYGYRVQYGRDSMCLQPLAPSSSVLPLFVPQDLIGQQSIAEWKEQILETYNSHGDLTSDESKVMFLQITYRWPTFGSSFYDVTVVSMKVKQGKPPGFPFTLRIVINKNGVSVADPATKELLATYAFGQITNWKHTHDRFQITVTDAEQVEVELHFETSMGYQMSGRIQEYIEMTSASEDLSTPSANDDKALENEETDSVEDIDQT